MVFQCPELELEDDDVDDDEEESKDKEGECHGSGHLEYDDGSYLAGAWDHGVREGHFRLDCGHPDSPVLHLEGDYRRDEHLVMG